MRNPFVLPAKFRNSGGRMKSKSVQDDWRKQLKDISSGYIYTGNIDWLLSKDDLWQFTSVIEFDGNESPQGYKVIQSCYCLILKMSDGKIVAIKKNNY